MANFVIDFLIFNRNKIDEIKHMTFDGEIFGNKWIWENLSIVVALCNTLIVAAIFIMSLLMFPLMVIMCTINIFYSIYLYLSKTIFFKSKYIKKSLKEYELSLNGKDTYYLGDNTNGNWKCINLNPDMEEFIKTFFNRYNLTYFTYESSTDKLVCKRHRRRSVGDIYLICKNYFPDTNLDEVIKCLIRLVNSNTLAVSKCSDIKKYVFVKKDSYTGNYMTKELEFMREINFEQLITYYERNGGLS